MANNMTKMLYTNIRNKKAFSNLNARMGKTCLQQKFLVKVMSMGLKKVKF